MGQSTYVPGLVSAVIPAFNAGPYVVQAVESVLAQTYPHVECIVVDDGSTDDTYQRLQPYMDRIRYVWQENQERSAARNHGIALARGEFLAFLDADDWWHRTKITKQVDMLARYPTAGLVYTWMRSTDESGNHLDLMQDGEITGLLRQPTIFRKLLLGKCLTGAGSTVLVRRQCIEKVGGFDTNYTGPEDWDFALRVAMHCDLACVAEPLAYYRRTITNLLETFDRRNVQDQHISILNKIFDMIPHTSEHSNLKGRAFAHAFWHGALIDYGLGKVDAAQQRAILASQWDSTYFSKPNPQCIEHVLSVARYLRYRDAFLDEAFHFVNFVFRNLPYGLQHLTGWRRQTLAKLYAGELFKAYADKDWSSIRQLSWRVVRYDPSWLRNKGFIKICILAWGWANCHG